MPYALITFLLSRLALLSSYLSKVTRQYIFDFNQTKSLIVFPLNSNFILKTTFSLTWSKNIESCG